ncbi:YgiQ family radical SAM protein [Candidatus Symbiobacter mobilis]|uniref:Oxidoreductase n=1 Tax=Candidatus Symbiobacter mobilis CR TaxID=946483 RepID=U5N7U9_9BURK|nr:YgiQ family radical SAM protein [Candidatus Symbiobacter mobilis]AGX87467.1 oxidoreductase [Candidatus Symbiobacter mobilis CR]
MTSTSLYRPCPAEAASLFGYRKYWAARFGVAPFLPMSHEEMESLGWDACDVILVTGDAYIDHPSFGMALIGRLLEAQGFRVGIVAQPDWRNAAPFRKLGAPRLFWGVTAGNMDSMVNHYTADRKIRSDDAYTPGGASGRRPDRAATVYCQRCREAFGGIPVVLGGIEGSLRRAAHYDTWSDTVRRSILLDAKCDLLLYGNAERAVVEVAHRLAAREPVANLTDIRGTAFVRRHSRLLSAEATTWHELDHTALCDATPTARTETCPSVVRLPSFEQVRNDPVLYAHASRILLHESNPHNARALVQAHGEGDTARDVWIQPPPLPLTTAELDHVYDLPYARSPHPGYCGPDGKLDASTRIPAWEMIRHSVTILRGCFGGCSFCSITSHEGRIVQSRSQTSILHEIEQIRDTVSGFTGTISDLGGATANMYRQGCGNPRAEALCRKPSCVYPDVCKNLRTDHAPLIALYRASRDIPRIKKVLIGSGVRYDFASRAYIQELAEHHVGGYLKIAPEHTEHGPLSRMHKPGLERYEHFRELFERCSTQAGKEQYLIPYFIAAHPGTSDEDMLALALWLQRNRLRVDQVQTFYPTPMTASTTMHHTGRDPWHPVHRDPVDPQEKVEVVRTEKRRKLHKAFLRYHDPANWPLLRAALCAMGRSDLIGHGKRHLVPPGEKTYPPGAAKSRIR